MATEIVLPKLGLTMDEAKVVTWLKDIGDFVKEDEVVLEVETDKANLEVGSPGEGYLVQKDVEPGDIVEVGKVLGMLSEKNENISSSNNNKDQVKERVSEEQDEKHLPKNKTVIENNRNPFLEGERIRVSPAARKFAKQAGLDLSKIVGTGPK